MTVSILETIGNTPLIEIRHLNPNPRVRMLAKLEYFNPGGSVKDRPALCMIAAGEKSGQLTADKTVIEATSGNTGIGLALVCSVKGYRLLLAMSESASMERRKILEARGAEILLTPGHLGTDGAIEEVYRVARENPGRYFMADQFNNPANWQAHYDGTGVEIWRQTDGKVDVFVASMGTSGTLMGVSRRLKSCRADIQVVGVEPYLGHKIQGLKNMKEAYRPEIYDKNRLDRKVNVEDEAAFEMTRQLAKREGLFVGMSSGAAMVAAQQEARRMDGGVLVVLFPDGGERYLSTPLFTVRKKIPLKVFNTLTRRRDAFEPLVPGRVSMYSCGPTAHARMHLGECRRMVFSDLLQRYLTYRGYDVKHVMNITDLDDKTIQGSEAAGQDLEAFTSEHIRAFERDLAFLGVKPAAAYPRASRHIDDMIRLAESLAERGYAYEKLRSLYFDISRVDGYGRLSGVDIDKIRLGATVDLDSYEKDNPRDFTLFKRSKLSELKRGLYTKTRWGNVRPSWHIQCAAMSMKHLGRHFDIHTSSRELVFPHHENEIAIAAALTGRPMANYWMHCDTVLVDGKKAGRRQASVALDALRQMGFSGRQIRYWLISTHYRKPVLFSAKHLESAARALKRLDICLGALSRLEGGRPCAECDQLVYDLKNGFATAMDDDLNISAAMAAIFSIVRRINRLIIDKELDAGNAAKILDVFRRIDTVLNFLHIPDAAENAEIRQLIARRQAARRAQDWQTADRIRRQLADRGVIIRDRAEGKPE